MITKHSVLFTASLALLGSAFGGLSPARAGDLDLLGSTDGKAVTLDEGRYDRERFIFTTDFRVGYDDNTLDVPDEISTQVLDPATGRLRTITHSQNVPDSVFINYDAGVSYTAANTRATFGVAADAGINYYFDRPGRDYDINGALTLRGTYKLSPRAFLEASSYNSYESEPDFGASNLTGFTGEVGAGVTYPGTSAERNGDFFYTTNHVALTYQFTPRISTVTSGDVVATAYVDEPYSTIEDRIELYGDEQFVYLLQPTLSAVAEYRFGYIDYFGISSDSISNFLLVGANYTFNPRLKGLIRGGVEFRDYVDGNEDDISPYFEGSLSYDLSVRSQLGLNLRYGIEEGDLSTSISNSRTLRLGLNFTQMITQRLSAYVSFYFTHNNYHSEANFDPNTGIFDTGSFVEDTYDVAAGLRYAFNRRVSAEIGYTHTDVTSEVDERQYDRNRYFTGVRFEF